LVIVELIKGPSIFHISGSWASAEFFQGEQRQHFADPCQVADNAMQMYVHETHYRFYTTTPHRNAPCYVNSHKKCASLAAIARYITICRFSKQGTSFHRSIAMVFNYLTAGPRYTRGCCLMLERPYGFRAGAWVGNALFWKGSGWKTLHDRNTNASQKR